MTQKPADKPENPESESDVKLDQVATTEKQAERTREIGGPKGLEPTRYGDWENNGRCSDF